MYKMIQATLMVLIVGASASSLGQPGTESTPPVDAAEALKKNCEEARGVFFKTIIITQFNTRDQGCRYFEAKINDKTKCLLRGDVTQTQTPLGEKEGTYRVSNACVTENSSFHVPPYQLRKWSPPTIKGGAEQILPESAR